MRNLKHEVRVGFLKTVFARYANCSLNMSATSNYERLFMFHFTLFVCLFVCSITIILILFSSFISFTYEHESKQSNFIFSCYWDPHNSARRVYLFICLSFIFHTVTVRNEITLVIYMEKSFFKTFLIVNIFKVFFLLFFILSIFLVDIY